MSGSVLSLGSARGGPGPRTYPEAGPILHRHWLPALSSVQTGSAGSSAKPPAALALALWHQHVPQKGWQLPTSDRIRRRLHPAHAALSRRDLSAAPQGWERGTGTPGAPRGRAKRSGCCAQLGHPCTGDAGHPSACLVDPCARGRAEDAAEAHLQRLVRLGSPKPALHVVRVSGGCSSRDHRAQSLSSLSPTLPWQGDAVFPKDKER